MKRILATLLALLCAVAPLAAFAEMQAEATLVYTTTDLYDTPTLIPSSDTFIIDPNKKLAVADRNGTVLVDTEFLGITIPATSSGISPYLLGHVHYHGVANTFALLNDHGQCISGDALYGSLDILSDKWVVALRYEDVTEEPFDGGMYRIVAADLYYTDNHVATLTRNEYKSGLTAHGDYIYLRNPHEVINRNGVRTIVDDPNNNYGLGFSEYDLYYDTDNHRMHWGSGQFAFTGDCTLTPEEVDISILYDGNGNFLDLQGNILFQTDLLANTHLQGLEVFGDRYIIIRNTADSLYYMFDLQGTPIIAGSSKISDGFNSNSGVMASGYQLYADTNGFLHYANGSGHESCTFMLHSNNADSTSMAYNLPFIFYSDAVTGKYTIITAAAGVLPVQYDAIATDHKYGAYASGAPLLGVVLNGKTGVIDLYGNTIIDFKYKNIQMNHDGTLVALDSGSMTTTDVYRIDYTDPAAEEAARLEAEAEAAAEAAATEQANPAIWHCDACNRDNDMNFCPGCGTARPKPLPVCSSCGYEAPDASYRFCPNCGQAF